MTHGLIWRVSLLLKEPETVFSRYFNRAWRKYSAIVLGVPLRKTFRVKQFAFQVISFRRLQRFRYLSNLTNTLGLELYTTILWKQRPKYMDVEAKSVMAGSWLRIHCSWGNLLRYLWCSITNTGAEVAKLWSSPLWVLPPIQRTVV